MVLTIVTFIIILSVLVLVHELGHFVVARLVGVEVEEFGLGLPPRITGKKWKGTLYSLNWLPIGGFVKLAGEDDEEKTGRFTQKSSKHLFWAKTKKERAAILLAGVAMNFVLAVSLTAYLLTQGVLEPAGRVHLERVISGSPAETAGLKVDDVVKNVHCQAATACPLETITAPRDLIAFTQTHKGEAIVLTIDRGQQEFSVTLTPRKDYPSGQGPMGVAVSDLEKRTYSVGQAPLKATEINLSRARDMLVSLGILVWRLITLQSLQADVAGPIGIAQVTGQAVKFGLSAVLEFMSVLSLNLAVLNVLPVPALDGGRLAFVFLEKILGRRVKPAFEKSTHQIGMIILFALILLVSINDILRLARGG